MIILPAIDLKDGKCVRLVQGDFDTAQVVAADAVETAKGFEKQGARWLHMVDLDGAKDGKPKNSEVIFAVKENTNLNIEVGGGIRDIETIDYYLSKGISRVILGSAALQNKALVSEAIAKYGKQIAVGIDAKNGKVAAEGWLETSDVDYMDFAKEMEKLGCSYLIVTDIETDGTLSGPNMRMLDRINQTVSCNIIASGGVSSIMDILSLHDMGMYGTIAGKSVYTGDLNLAAAVIASQRLSKAHLGKNREELDDNLERYFQRSELLPAIIQEEATGDVLMLAYMNQESLEKSIATGYTWFYSRSRKTLWNKGETSGNTQEIISISADCDDDTLLIRVKQNGPACHTGQHSCFFKQLL